MRLPIASVVCASALTGCLSHMPPTSLKHMEVNWAASFDDAQARAHAEHKPILVCMVAGELSGLC